MDVSGHAVPRRPVRGTGGGLIPAGTAKCVVCGHSAAAAAYLGTVRRYYTRAEGKDDRLVSEYIFST